VKKIFVVLVALVTFATYAFAEGDKNQKRLDGEISQGDTQQERITNPNNGVLPLAQLDEEQKATIYAIYEEEKLARDVYRTLGNVYPEENTFANIQFSEQAHMDAVKNLCERYDITIIVSDETGVFTIIEPHDFQGFYNDVYITFVEEETGSLLEALEIGQEIEVMDSEDLELLLSLDFPLDVKKVFTNLLNGSYNHLDAFNNAIDRETSQ
jgi:hypothetical protein